MHDAHARRMPGRLKALLRIGQRAAGFGIVAGGASVLVAGWLARLPL